MPIEGAKNLMVRENEPAEPEMVKDLVQAQVFDLLRDQTSINTLLLQVVIRLASHASIPESGFNSLTGLISESLGIMKQQVTKFAETEELLRKLHTIPKEQPDGE
jgi:hypothetical protein